MIRINWKFHFEKKYYGPMFPSDHGVSVSSVTEFNPWLLWSQWVGVLEPQASMFHGQLHTFSLLSKKVPSMRQVFKKSRPWKHWQKVFSQGPSSNSPSSVQTWFLQGILGVVVDVGSTVVLGSQVVLSMERERAWLVNKRTRNRSIFG